MDEVDASQKSEQLFMEDALAKRKPVGRPGFESLFRCAECEAEIPERRRQAIQGCMLCAACQEEQDRNSHLS